jgi:Secretion system C-terminal sorting domain
MHSPQFYLFFLCCIAQFSPLLAQNCWQEQPAIQGNKVVCTGKSIVLTATEATKYEWSTGETSPSIEIAPLSRQMYYVTVTNKNGCTEVLSQAVAVASLALKPMQNVVVEKGKSATVGFYANQLQYQWSNEETTPQITVKPDFTSIYTVTATTKTGCSATSEVLVEVDLPLSAAISETAALEKISNPVEIQKDNTEVKIEVPRTAISMYPNPIAHGDATVKVVTNVEDLNAVAIVSDLWGRTILTQRSELFMGTNYLKINTNSLATGTYVVRIVSNQLRFDAQKLVKL